MNHTHHNIHTQQFYSPGKTNKQTNESSWGRMMNNFNSIVHYFLSDFQTLRAQTQVLELNSVYSGEKVNIFLWLKNLHSLDLFLHNDWSEHCFHKRRWTEAHLREFTCAYLSSPAGDSCSASVQTVSRDWGSWGNQEWWFKWQSCFFCNNNAIQFCAIALAKGNRIKLSVTTNVPYHGRMMKHLLCRENFFISGLISKGCLVKFIFTPKRKGLMVKCKS